MDQRFFLAEITPVFPPYRGGTGTVAQENARMAVAAGIPTTVFTPRYRAMQKEVRHLDQMSGLAVVRVRPFYAVGNAAFLPQLFWKLRNFSVIHLHYPCIGLEFPALFWRLMGKRLLVTYHMDLVGKSLVRKLLFRIYTVVTMPLIMRAADRVLVSSFDYAKNSPILSPFIKKYIQKMVELPNSVDTVRFSPSSGNGVQPYSGTTLKQEENEKIILFVGGLDVAHYFKGVTVLLDAGALLAEHAELPSWRISICGDGDLRASYEEHARALGITDRVSFLGSVSHELLPDVYRSATCVVLPSFDSTEAFGVVLIEAGACGKPVIATNLPGVRSVVVDGKTGYLVEPHDVTALADRIVGLLHDKAGAERMGAAGLQHVRERYAYSVVAQKFVSYLYR